MLKSKLLQLFCCLKLSNVIELSEILFAQFKKITSFQSLNY